MCLYENLTGLCHFKLQIAKYLLHSTLYQLRKLIIFLQIKDLFDTFTQKIKLHFWPLPVSSQQHPVKQAGNKASANLCKTMIIRKKCVSVANSLHDDWTLTTKWDLCKKSIPTWSLDYREAIDTPTWYLIGKNFFYVNQFGACHAFLMNFQAVVSVYTLVWSEKYCSFVSVFSIYYIMRNDVYFSHKIRINDCWHCLYEHY